MYHEVVIELVLTLILPFAGTRMLGFVLTLFIPYAKARLGIFMWHAIIMFWYA